MVGLENQKRVTTDVSVIVTFYASHLLLVEDGVGHLGVVIITPASENYKY